MRILYLDRLKVLCTVLVILHHLAITYGGIGSWYYFEHQDNDVANILLSMFVIVNQSFFMGLFFFISGYFTPASFDRKGAAVFLKDRIIRFGIPIIIFTLVIQPILVYVSSGFSGSFIQYVKEVVFSSPMKHLIEVNTGPLWFIEALLIFSFGYVIVRKILPNKNKFYMLTFKKIILYILFVGTANFLIRLFMPVGESIISLQLGYFPAYIALFAAGICAYRGNWLTQLNKKTAKRWGVVVIIQIILIPIALALGGALEGNTESFNGGASWQSIFYSFADPILGLGISYILIVFYKERFNQQSSYSSWLASQAYTVYIIHALIATYVSFWFKDISLYPILKFAIVAAIVTPLCFFVSYVIRLLPYSRKVL